MGWMQQKQDDVAEFLRRARKRKGGTYTASQTGAAQIAQKSGGFSLREPTVDEMIQRSIPEYGQSVFKEFPNILSMRKRPRRKSRTA